MDLVTGGGGYLGSHLSRALLASGRRVRVLDVARADLCPDGVEFVHGDVRDAPAVRSALAGVRRVFHIAFVQSLSRRPERERRAVNLGGMANLLAASEAAGVERFVFASTIEIYGTSPPDPCPEDASTDRPVGWYGRHKLECEGMLRDAGARGLPGTALRMPTICGRGFYNHRPLLLLMDRILDGRPVAVAGDGSVPGDFVAVGDVVGAFLLAGERPEAPGEAFNVSAKESASHLAVVRAMIEAVGSPSRVLRVPAPVARAALWAGRLLRIHDLPACQDGYLFHPNRYSIEKARRLLGYSSALTATQAAAALVLGYREDRESVRRRARRY